MDEMTDGESRSDERAANRSGGRDTIVEHVLPEVSGRHPQQADTRPPEAGAGNTRFLRALRALPVADMATLAPPSSSSAGDLGTTARLTEGRRDDKYTVGAVLGSGGMGVVRETRDEHLERAVALKSLHDGSEADPRLAQLLIREARLTGQLEHPNIVPVYDLGALGNGEFFYTMRLYRGVTLATVLRQLREQDSADPGEWGLPALLQIFRQICMAVAFAHSRGVIHRDLKPDNVLVGDYGEVQVTDWGVAQVQEDADVSVPPLIPSGGDDSDRSDPVGTPRYMSPEQARGVTQVEPRSDIYSLGVILYEILTLESPYETNCDVDSLLEAVREGAVAMPETRNPNRPVAPELVSICLRALSAQPQRRHPTARELWRDIAAYLRGDRERKRQAAWAQEEVERGREAAERYYEILSERRALEARIAERQAVLKPWHPLSERQQLWELRDLRDRLEIVLGRTFSQAQDHFTRALVHQPEHESAQTSLARLYWSKLGPAIDRGDYQDIVYYGGLVKRLSDPNDGPLKAGSGLISIRTLPEGADITIHEAADLVPGTFDRHASPAGIAPLMDMPLKSGVYVIVARVAGYREVRRPVLIQAGETKQVLLGLAPLHEDRPMVGRDGELGHIKALFESAVENRKPTFCLVRARPGMGKTKLLDAFASYLHRKREPIILFYTEPRRTHPLLPFAPLADLFAFRAGIKSEDGRDLRERKVVDMVHQAFSQNETRQLTLQERLLVEETADDLCLLPDLVHPSTSRSARARLEGSSLTPAERRRRIMTGIRVYLEVLGQWHAAYLRVRSAHRMDRSSLEALDRVRSSARRPPLFVLGDVPFDGHDDTLSEVFVERLSLPPFDKLSIERFASNYLDGSVDQRLVDALADLSGGRPGHLQVALPLLAETQHILREGERWCLSDRPNLPPEASGYRSTVRRLVFGPLSDQERRLLRRAAVAGRVFSRKELRALGVEDPDATIAALTERQVLRPRPTAGHLWSRIYAFATDTLWEIAYNELVTEERRGLHLRLAEYLAEIPEPPAEGVALMADHFRRGGRSADAARCLRRLADHARELDARHEQQQCRRQAHELSNETT